MEAQSLTDFVLLGRRRRAEVIASLPGRPGAPPLPDDADLAEHVAPTSATPSASPVGSLATVIAGYPEADGACLFDQMGQLADDPGRGAALDRADLAGPRTGP